MSDDTDARSPRLRYTLAGVVVLVLLLGFKAVWWARQAGAIRTDRDAVAAQLEAARAEVEARRAAELERQARNAAAIEELLTRCEEALRNTDAAGAAISLAEAERGAAEGGSKHARARLARLRADLATLRELDRIDNLRWTAIDGRLPDPVATAARLAPAFQRLGIVTEASPEDAARRINESANRDRLLAGLDLWLVGSRSPAVLAVLKQTDPDPFRTAVREAIQANDGPRVAELAARPEAAEQPPRFVLALAESRSVPVERRRSLLTAALHRQPGNYDLLMSLGSLLANPGQDRSAEQIAWYRAAVALRPANPTGWMNLGTSLLQAGDPTGAIEAFREAIRLDPTNAQAHFNLGTAFAQKCPSDEAIAALRQAIRLDPSNPAGHAELGKVLRARGDEDGAIACFREAARLDPKTYDALLKPRPAVAPAPRPANL